VLALRFSIGARSRRGGRTIGSGSQGFHRLRAGEAGTPKFEQVVGGGDQLPFGLAGSEAASEEAVAAPDDFRVCEYGFDDLLSPSVERLSFGF
jgi:hypothetical protein